MPGKIAFIRKYVVIRHFTKSFTAKLADSADSADSAKPLEEVGQAFVFSLGARDSPTVSDRQC